MVQDGVQDVSLDITRKFKMVQDELMISKYINFTFK